MNVRREVATDMLSMTRKILGYWERKIKARRVEIVDGLGNAEEEDDVEGEMVVGVIGDDEVLKMRAELMAVAATLEGLAST